MGTCIHVHVHVHCTCTYVRVEHVPLPHDGDVVGVSGRGLDVMSDVKWVATSLMVWSVVGGALVGVVKKLG